MSPDSSSSTSACSAARGPEIVAAFLNLVSEQSKVPMKCINQVIFHGNGAVDIVVIVRDAEGFPVVDLESKDFVLSAAQIELPLDRNQLKGYRP